MVNIQNLKTLREETGVSLALCKKALEKSNQDLEKAKKLLQQWGAEVLIKKAGAAVSEGAIFSYIHHNKKNRFVGGNCLSDRLCGQKRRVSKIRSRNCNADRLNSSRNC